MNRKDVASLTGEVDAALNQAAFTDAITDERQSIAKLIEDLTADSAEAFLASDADEPFWRFECAHLVDAMRTGRAIETVTMRKD
jgi:hypothetical protein